MDYCRKCGEPLSDGQSVCPECGFINRFDSAGNMNTEEDFSMQKVQKVQQVQPVRKRTKKNPVNKKAIVYLLIGLAVILGGILAVWSLYDSELINNLLVQDEDVSDQTVITADASLVELEVGEEKTIMLDLKNTPQDFVITYEDSPLVTVNWLDWEEQDVRIPLSFTGKTEGVEVFRIYMYDKDDPDQQVIAETHVGISVKNQYGLRLKSDIERLDFVIGESVDVVITIEGDLPSNYYVRVYGATGLETTWKDFINSYSCPLTCTATEVSEGTLKVSLHDSTESEEGIYICSVEIPFSVREE